MTPRVLWVTPEVPDRDGGGGAIRQANLLIGLAGRFDIDLLVAGRVTDPAVRAAVREVIEVPVREVAAPGRLRAVWELAVRRRPLFAAASARTLDALAGALPARVAGCDVVVVHHEELLPLLARCGAALRVLHLFDVKSVRAEQTAGIAHSTPSARLWQAEARAARRVERAWLGEADVLVACTADDLRVLEGLGPRPGPDGVVVRNGVDHARFRPSPPPGSARVLFLGSLDYEPNIDGIGWFVDAVWPAVRAGRPEATLTVAGHRPGAEVRALGTRPGVTVIGPVASAADTYADHDLVVVPLRVGTGSRLKALEAMAAGRPVVGTTIGLEGLDLDLDPAHRETAVVADTPAELARAVTDLLGDPARVAAIVSAARARVEARFGWDTGAAVLAGTIERHLADRTDGEVAGATVLVCTRGRAELLDQALASLDAALDPRDELLVVEADGSAAAAAVGRLSSSARHLTAPRPGKSRQLNQGLRAATRAVVVMTDDDCRVAPGWVAAMAAPFADPSVGVVFGNVTGLSGVRDVTVPTLPPGEPPAVTWEYANGAAMAVRRAAALAIGGFDERLGPGAPVHGEEHDLVLRLQAAGWRVRIADAPVVEHLEWRDEAETRRNLLVYSRGAGAFVGLAVRRSPRAGLRLLARRTRYQATLWRHAGAEGRSFGPATSLAFARGLAHGLRLKPKERR